MTIETTIGPVPQKGRKSRVKARMAQDGIDLSVGWVIWVSGKTCATLAAAGFPVAIAVAGALAFELIAGLLTGFINNEAGIPPLITTLDLMTSLRGVSCIIGGGLPVYGVLDGLKAMGRGYVLGIPAPVILMAITLTLGHIVLTHTRFGREVDGVCGNEEAARLSGVLAGVLIMGVLANGMILLNINECVQWVVKGAVLLAAFALDQFIHRQGKAG